MPTPHIPISPNASNASCTSRYQHNMFRLRMYKTCQHSFEVQPQVGLAKPYRPPPRPTSGQPTFDHLSKGKLLNICPRQSNNLGIPPYPVSCPWTWVETANKQANKVANRSQDSPTKILLVLVWALIFSVQCYTVIKNMIVIVVFAWFCSNGLYHAPTHPHDTDTVYESHVHSCPSSTHGNIWQSCSMKYDLLWPCVSCGPG